MMPSDVAPWIEFFRTLGVAGPLVGFLVFIYNKSDAERRETQSKFLEALQTTITNTSVDRQANTAALVELASVVRRAGEDNRGEHEKMLGVIHDIAEHLDVRKSTLK